MNLSPQAEREIKDALDQVRERALDIPDEADLDTLRQSLRTLRDAILYAGEAINLAEDDARKAALAAVRTFA